MTHSDGLPHASRLRFSARSVRRGDAGHGEPRAPSTSIGPSAPGAESPGLQALSKPPFRSPMGPGSGRIWGRRKVLTMPRIAYHLPPTRRAPWATPTGHYHRSLV